MTRRRLLFAGAASAAAAASYPTLIEPGWLEATSTPVNLGRGGGTLRILHLTDLHASYEVPVSFIDEAIGMGLARQPDVICLTGDFVSRGLEVDSRQYEAVLKRLTVKPVFAVLGNHDGGKWSALRRRGLHSPNLVTRLLERAGIEVLDNRRRLLEVNGARLQIAGVADLWSGRLDAEAAFAGAEPGVPAILMAHNPDTKDVVGRFPWDLMLSGHTHGGQVIIPFDGPRFAPVRDKRYVSGLGKWEGRQIYVSRGIGSYGHVRFRCRPEVSILDITV